jgi:hypothetical protein
VSAAGDKPKWAIYLIYAILAILFASSFLIFFVLVASQPTTISTATSTAVPTSSQSSTIVYLSSQTASIPH